MTNDLISRQDAIDALHMHLMYRMGTDSNKKRLDEWINNLPSAQPEPCEDTVSRQRLLSDLKELVAAWKKYPVMAEQIKGVEAAIGYVELIPSAQPELIEKAAYIRGFEQGRTQGMIDALEKEFGDEDNSTVPAHWIDQGHKIFKCSNCGNYLDFGGVNAGRGTANYCPNCGAKMDEE